MLLCQQDYKVYPNKYINPQQQSMSRSLTVIDTKKQV